MNILITGADGFIGRGLVTRILASETLPLTLDRRARLILLDQKFGSVCSDARVEHIEGDIAAPKTLERALASEVQYVFHLASLPGGAAEAHFEDGLKVNFQATATLFELLRGQRIRPTVVFASSVGVYGVPLPETIDEKTAAEPTLSYGAHKLVGEILLLDYSRRGYIDGRSVRLPGIVARPPHPSGLLSAFMSEVIVKLSAGLHFTCPVSADGMSWWMSRPCALENLLHAATLDPSVVRKRRSYLLPVLHASIADVVAAIADIHGPEVTGRITFNPDAQVQAQFANLPPLHCPESLAAGFRHDGTLERLVQRALEGH